MSILPRTAVRSGDLAQANRRRTFPTAYLFILPYLVLFILFRLGPSLAGLGIAFTNWQAVGTPGVDRPGQFPGDGARPRLGEAIRNTIGFTAVTVPVLVVLSLALALFLNRPMRGRTLGRVAVFMPYVVMSTVVGVVWTWILDKDFGLMNVYLQMFGLSPSTWLVSERTAMWGIILTTVWWTVGYNMVLFLAGLQDIPGELYEAARIDGANTFGIFRFVTLPLLAPTTFLVLMLTLINSFQVFDQVYVMTSGGPGTATLTLVQYIYTTSFQFQRFGYGSAVTVILFIMLVFIAFFQIRAYRRGLQGVE
ncbi:MAG: sugar ABC transporter permease [Chloroflexi bacterium]|nr:sugar ABC transporter permease [Chloroflexota bacterium]